MAGSGALAALVLLASVAPCCLGQRAFRNLTDPECRRELEEWMWTLRPEARRSDATLSVPWGELDRRLSTLRCTYDELWMELWRLSKEKSWRREDVRRFNTCDNLDRDVFSYHSTTLHQRDSAADDDDRFRHAVEEKYLFRLCPCGRRRVGQKCDCEYADSGGSFCSDIVRMDGVEAGTPFDFCRRDGSTEARSGKMHVPVSSCSGTTLRGELASCTPVQDSYDRVRVSLHRREDGREGDCGVNDHSAEGKVLEVEAPLSRINRTHGSFVASFDGEGRTGRLGEDGENVSYCLKLELVDHPYCQADHQIGQSSSPVPKVCSTHVLKPLKMGAGGCGGTPSSSAAVLSRTGVNAGIIATVVLVSAAFLATLLFLSRRKRNSPPARDEMDEEEKQAGGGIIKQNAPLIVSAPSDDGRKVFLLHFSEKNRPEKFAKVNAALRQWISAASGAEVFDPSDEARQEEVAAEQEGWAERLLLDKACACNRVVVVDGPAAAAALPDGGGGGGETAPLNGGGGDDDPLQDLKVAALRHLQSPTFVGDYSRLALVTYSPASSSCSALANLTSMRSHLRLPEHLPELAAWLAGAASSSSKGAAAEETRLRSAIRSLDTTAASNGHAAGHALA